LCPLSTVGLVKSENLNQTNLVNTQINSNYLNSKKELQDYIIDTGDNLFIEFFPAQELSDFYSVNEEGEIYLPRLRETNVRGLTTSELEKFLEQKYVEYLISPKINVKIAIFRSINITVAGEVRYPGLYKFLPFKGSSIQNFLKDFNANTIYKNDDVVEDYDLVLPEVQISNEISSTQNQLLIEERKLDRNNPFINYLEKVKEGNITKISDVIRKAGGITSSSDLKKIQIIRNIPVGKGGGKKSALVNLDTLLDGVDNPNDIRLFDGDHIFIPALTNSNKAQVPKSVLSGLSPRFIKVNVFGRVNTPGEFMLPLQGTLSDALDITGPIKPLSGKVVLIRYNNDGTISKKKIAYSASAPRGSRRNPFIKEGDLITVTSSVFSKTADAIQVITAPLQGIYFTKELIEDLQE
jgi:polysaccharide export outer membrane protein